MGLLVTSIHRDMLVCTLAAQCCVPSLLSWVVWTWSWDSWGVINTEHRNTWPQLPGCSLQPSQRAWEGLSGSESDGYKGP